MMRIKRQHITPNHDRLLRLPNDGRGRYVNAISRACLKSLTLWLLVIALGLWMTACHRSSPAPAAPLALPQRAMQLEQVPFYPQEAFQCGPAAMASVLNYYNAQTTPDEITAAIFRPNLRATVTLDMMLYARRQGFRAVQYTGSPEKVQRAIEAHTPLIVMVDQGLGGISQNHFMVVVGFDPDGLVVHSGKARNKHLPWKSFLRQWQRTDYWTLRIEPPSQHPLPQVE